MSIRASFASALAALAGAFGADTAPVRLARARHALPRGTNGSVRSGAAEAKRAARRRRNIRKHPRSAK